MLWLGATPGPEARQQELIWRPVPSRYVLPRDWPEEESWNAVEADLEEQFADLVFALGGSFMQRRELPQVGHVDGGAVSDQQLGHLVVAVGAGVVERHQPPAQRDTRHFTALLSALTRPHVRGPPFVLGVHIRPVVQQVLHHRHSVVTSSKMKRRGVSPLQVPAVHILSRAQRLQTEAGGGGGRGLKLSDGSGCGSNGIPGIFHSRTWAGLQHFLKGNSRNVEVIKPS